MNTVIGMLFGLVFHVAGFFQASSGLPSPSVVSVYANASTTGTTVNTLTKLTGAPSTAVITATTDTAGSIGVCVANCGTSGVAGIQVNGLTNLVIDNATTAGDYIQISSTTAGNGHDAGSTCPSSGQVVGRVLSTHGSGGTYQVNLGSNGCGSGGASGITQLTGDVTAGPGSGSQTSTISANAVTTTKINNSAVTLAKIQNAGGSSVLVGAQTSGAPYTEITLGTNLSMSGGVLNASGGGGGGYTNVTGSGSQTTVAALNTLCGSGTLYVTTPLSIATGGTLTCPTQFSKAGALNGSVSVTFTYPVTKTDAPSQIFGSGMTISLPTQNAYTAWWGDVNDYSGGTSGTDDTTAIQACITALTSGECRMSNNGHKISSALSISKSNVKLVGVTEGNTPGATINLALTNNPTVLVQMTAATDGIDVGGSGPIINAGLKNLMILSYNIASGTASGVSANNCGGCIFDHVSTNDFVNDWSLGFVPSYGTGYFRDIDGEYGRFQNGGPTYGSITLSAFNFNSSASYSSARFERLTGDMLNSVHGTSTASCFAVTGTNVADIEGHWFECGATMDYGYLVTTTATGFNAYDMSFFDSTIDAINISCIKTVNFVGSQLHFSRGTCNGLASGEIGIDIEGSGVGTSGNIIIDGWKFKNGSTPTSLTGIYVNASSWVTLSNIQTESGDTFKGTPIKINNSDRVTVTGGNIVNDVAAANVLVTGSAGVNITGLSIDHNGAGGTGVSFDSASSHNISIVTCNATDITTCTSDSGTADRWIDNTGTNIGGSPSFSTITGGTNTIAAMICGTGCSIAASGSGTIAATSLVALTGMPTEAADTVVMNSTGSSAAPTAVAMPTCTTGADLYNTSTHTWSCVSTGGGTTTNALTMNNSGSGATSGTTFDGSVARTISYNTIGAAPLASPTFTGTPAAPTATGGTSTTQLATTAFVQAAIAAASTGSGIVTYSGPSLTFTGTLYFPIGGGGLSSTTETNVDIDSPAATTIQNMTVQMSAAPGIGNSITYTWRKNASSTALTCTISGASATSCSDTTHSFTTVALDLLDIQVVTTGTVVGTPTVVMAAQVGVAASGGGGGLIGPLFKSSNTSGTVASGSATSKTTPAATYAANDLVVCFVRTNTNTTTFTWSSSPSNTWNTLPVQTNGQASQMAWAIVGAGSTTVTATYSGSDTFGAVICNDYSGTGTTLVGSAQGTGSGTSLVTAGASTTQGSLNVICSAVASASGVFQLGTASYAGGMLATFRQADSGTNASTAATLACYDNTTATRYTTVPGVLGYSISTSYNVQLGAWAF